MTQFNIGQYVILHNHEILYDGYVCEIKTIKDNKYDILPLGEHFILANIDENKLIKFKNNNIDIYDKKDGTNYIQQIIYPIIDNVNTIIDINDMMIDFEKFIGKRSRNIDKNEIVTIYYNIPLKYIYNGSSEPMKKIIDYITHKFKLNINTYIKNDFSFHYNSHNYEPFDIGDTNTIISQLLKYNIYIICKKISSNKYKICDLSFNDCPDTIIFSYIKNTDKEKLDPQCAQQ